MQLKRLIWEHGSAHCGALEACGSRRLYFAEFSFCRLHRSNTQVSFVPPPWLELTTRDPFFSATRVSPPGTMRTRSRPVRTNGRRSTWRGATPSSTQVGHVDSASVGCATKFFGLDLSLTRKPAMFALSAAGPINMP